MSAITVTVIIAVLLVLYYAGMVTYDLYMQKLADANKEEDKEEIEEISGMEDDFISISVNDQQEEFDNQDAFIRDLRMGYSPQKINSIMEAAGNGENVPELLNILHILKQ